MTRAGVWRIVLGSLAVLLISNEGRSHSGDNEKPNPRFEKVNLVGELVDPMCFMIHDGQGPSHAACAERCARGGQTLAFADRESGFVYPLIGRMHGENPNAKLYRLLGKEVRVKGALFRRGPSYFLQISEVVLGQK